MASETLAPAQAPAGMVWIPGGTFRMGSDRFYAEERPVHEATVDGFWMDACEVTNDQFARFVERDRLRHRRPSAHPTPRISRVRRRRTSFPVRWSSESGAARSTCATTSTGGHGCRARAGATRKGPGSSLEGLEQHPVVHVAYEDVEAYVSGRARSCRPRRSGSSRHAAVWTVRRSPGGRVIPDGKAMANTWQGEFPWQNLLADGHEGTSPVGSFPPNGYGLYDMAGNVWEWTSDWYDREARTRRSSPAAPAGRTRARPRQKSYDPRQPQFRIPRRVVKGGSHLCAPNYCLRYRPAARQPQMIDSGMAHVGFRCVIRPGRSS